MERLLQYMDDLDDFFGAFGLLYEQLRRLFIALAAFSTSFVLMAAGIWLARVHPPVALAACFLLFVTLLYRAVTAPSRGQLQIT